MPVQRFYPNTSPLPGRRNVSQRLDHGRQTDMSGLILAEVSTSGLEPAPELIRQAPTPVRQQQQGAV